MMDLSTFLNHWLVPDESRFTPLICFYGVDEVPHLFFGHLIQNSRVSTPGLLESLDIRDTSFEVYKPRLYTSFLGKRMVYWLSGLTGLSQQEQMRIYAWLKLYKGPHTIMFFSGKHCEVAQNYGVQLPEYVDKSACMTLLHMRGQSDDQTGKNLSAMLIKMKHISLEKACLLMHYSCVLGRIHQTGVQEWLERIIAPDTSLFVLSKAFLYKEEQQFFKSWSTLQDQYPSSFWIAFWSEQVWRAFLYTQCMQTGRHSEAKTIGYRLPFAFLQRGWQSAHTIELRQAHAFICQLDGFIKHGGHEFFIELFYLKFFSSNFADSV